MNSMRITSGALRGRKIATPGGLTHPMGERERLALFNMVSDIVAGAKVLDAFSGSGALGIEALSRGAKTVTFIDNNPVAVKVIKSNLSELSLTAEVLKEKVSEYKTKSKFDLILADPPYDDFKDDEIKHLIPFLEKGGVLVLSHPKEAPVLDGLVLQKTRKYARARISIYRYS